MNIQGPRGPIALVIALLIYGAGWKLTYELYLPDTSPLTRVQNDRAFVAAMVWPVTLPLRVGWLTVSLLPGIGDE